MAKQKYDAVVDAVHYKPDGKVAWVRTYQRRGPTFSDIVIVDRQKLIKDLESGKIYRVGRRIPQMGGTFEVHEPLQLIKDDGKEVLVTGDTKPDRERLLGVPVI